MNLMTSIFILVIFAFVILLGGFLAPGWYVYDSDSDDNTYHIGLWYGIYCWSVLCVPTPLLGVSTTLEKILLPYRLESTFAIVLAIVTLLLVVKLRRPSYGDNRTFFIIAIGTGGISGILAIVAAATNGDRISKLSRGNDDIRFPYATFIFGIGGALMLILSVLLIIYLLCLQRDQNGMHGNRSPAMNYVTQQAERNNDNAVIQHHGNAYPGIYQYPQYRDSRYMYRNAGPNYSRSRDHYPEPASHFSTSRRYLDAPHYNKSKAYNSDYYTSSMRQPGYEDAYSHASVHHVYSSSRPYENGNQYLRPSSSTQHPYESYEMLSRRW